MTDHKTMERDDEQNSDRAQNGDDAQHSDNAHYSDRAQNTDNVRHGDGEQNSDNGQEMTGSPAASASQGLAAAFAGVDEAGQFLPIDEDWKQERARWNHDIQSGRLKAEDPEDLVVSHYFVLQEQAFALVKGEDDWIANAANLSSLLFNNLDDISFAGVYRLVGTELVLGPFMGKPACVRIPVGQGVCGVTAQKKSATFVPDVREFSGHIACDPASRSEVVVPVFDKNAGLWGVFDFDSPKTGRFAQTDVTWLSRLADVLFHHE